jgi:hypothetical protein
MLVMLLNYTALVSVVDTSMQRVKMRFTELQQNKTRDAAA